MRFLLDVNVGSTIARALVESGHDVIRAALTNPRSVDPVILDRAVAEDRILITYDSDFCDLIFHHGAKQPPAIIHVRFEPDEVADILPRLMPLLDFALLDGHMTVIGSEHTRRRPFPSKSNPDA